MTNEIGDDWTSPIERIVARPPPKDWDVMAPSDWMAALARIEKQLGRIEEKIAENDIMMDAALDALGCIELHMQDIMGELAVARTD